MQIVSDVAQNPTVAKSVPPLTVGMGFATIEQWLPFTLGIIASLMGMVASVAIVYFNLAQHRIKMEIYKRDLEERKYREGRKDRRDD